MSIPFFVWFDFYQLKDGFLQYILNASTVNFWIKGIHPTWYIAFITVLYLLFPLIYKWDKKTQHVSTTCILVFSVVSEFVMYKIGFWLYDTAEIALSRIPVFLVGILAAPTVLSGKRISFWKIIMLLFVGMYLYALIKLHPLPLIIIRYTYCPISIAIVVCYSFFRQIFNLNWLWRVFAWVGTISLELYIVHILIRRVVSMTDSWTLFAPIYWWIMIPVVSFLLAIALQYITRKINLKWIQ